MDLSEINRELAKRNNESMSRLYEAFRRIATCEECGQPLTAEEIDDWAQNDPTAETWMCDACAFIPDNIPSQQDY